jgi:hypothetical protein
MELHFEKLLLSVKVLPLEYLRRIILSNYFKFSRIQKGRQSLQSIIKYLSLYK